MRDFFEIIYGKSQCFTLNKYMRLLFCIKTIFVFVSVIVFLNRRILNYRQEKRHWIWLISIAVYSMNACIMDLLLKKFPLQAFFLEKRSFQPWKIWIIVLYSKYTFTKIAFYGQSWLLSKTTAINRASYFCNLVINTWTIFTSSKATKSLNPRKFKITWGKAVQSTTVTSNSRHNVIRNNVFFRYNSRKIRFQRWITWRLL